MIFRVLMQTYFVDSFTNQKFKGNPAAVCMVEQDVSTSKMQNIATEIGFSETAFIRKTKPGIYDIRFFTPKKEIALCGHATLASSRIIFDTTDLEQISFFNYENIELRIVKKDGKIVMQFPVYDTEKTEVSKLMLDALGINRVIESRYSQKNKIILIEMEDVEALALLQPDFVALVNSHDNINGVLVTARSTEDPYDFHYRYFWPWAGTNEDPVTGGVQTFLTKYWALKLNKNRLKAFQSSARTGEMTTELFNDFVLIYGEAVTVFEGKFKDVD